MVRLMHFQILKFFFSLSFIFTTAITYTKEKKQWTFIVYAAADNNLRDFAPRNMKQMSVIGSNQHVNLLVHLDIRLTGNKKTTRRYLIQKNESVQLEIPNEKVPMDSGDPQSLISACRWAVNEFPAEHYALVLWNHGTGIIDPYGKRSLNTNNLLLFNPTLNQFELDRTIGFLDLIEELNNDPKGICFDDTTGNSLTNQKLEFALNEITTNLLGGKKLDIIAFDACLMSMLEIAEITKKFAHFQVSSQEVEPGPGWKYDEALSPFAKGQVNANHLAIHIVDAFARAYKVGGTSLPFADYTQSALDLSQVDKLETNIDLVGQLLMQGMQSDAQAYKHLISHCRSRKMCTHFNEPSYIDLNHFYSNLLKMINDGGVKRGNLASELQHTLEIGQLLIKNIVLHSVSGPHLPHASGLSVYFPEKKIHPSYKKCNFAKNNWYKFLTNYLLS